MEEWDSRFPDCGQAGAEMMVRTEAFGNSMLCEMQAYEITLPAIAHALTVMPAQAGIPLTSPR